MDTSKIAVSVIVPVYGTEAYFDRMIGSVKNQTLRNIEIIVVNDCSPGNINSLIKKYISEDNRIRYVQTVKNSGVGGARNLGMKYATGDYIMFVDSDDWIDLDTLESMYNAAILKNADIVNCGLYRDYDNGEKGWNTCYNKDYVVDGETALKMLAHQFDYGVELCASPANKIYRHQLIKDIHFKEQSFYEEALFNFMVVRKAKTVAFVKTGKYTYFKREGSNLQSITPKHIQDFHDVFAEIKSILNKEGVLSSYMLTYTAYLEYFFFILLEQIYGSSESNDIKKQLVKNTLNSFDGLINLDDYIEYLGIGRFRWNLQPLMMHNGSRLL